MEYLYKCLKNWYNIVDNTYITLNQIIDFNDDSLQLLDNNSSFIYNNDIKKECYNVLCELKNGNIEKICLYHKDKVIYGIRNCNSSILYCSNYLSPTTVGYILELHDNDL
jgi:hypothetical protein